MLSSTKQCAEGHLGSDLRCLPRSVESICKSRRDDVTDIKFMIAQLMSMQLIQDIILMMLNETIFAFAWFWMNPGEKGASK